MRAVVVREFGPIEALQLGELPDPVPGPGEVLVGIKATAVNYVDLLVVGGLYQFLPPRPFAPGKLPVGEVLAVGRGVTALRPGDRVQTFAESGGFAEKVCLAAADCIALPDTLSYVDAAAISLASDTAWFALKDRAQLAAGETVLVLGASGAVGLAAIQLAKAFGASVIAAIANPASAPLVREAGADALVDLSVANLRDGLRDQVWALTDGRGADVVLDMVGGDVFDAALRAIAWRGRLIVIGFVSGRIPSVKANYLLLKNIAVIGLQVTDYRKRMPELARACFAEIFALVAAGKLRVPHLRTYPMREFAAALHAVEDRAIRDRVILTVG